MTSNNFFKRIPLKLQMEDAVNQTSSFIEFSLRNSSPIVSDITVHLTKSRGKGIRTRLVLASAMDQESMIHQNAIRIASAIELLHMATLVHDDIIDDATVRRGVETLQSKFGKKSAVIGGDYLLCLALSILSPLYTYYDDYKDNPFIHIIPALTNSLESICLGEYRQHTNFRNLEISIYDYLKTIAGKTAALFSISSQAGAFLIEKDIRQIKLLTRFGKYLGMIFQIIDDCKDYELTQDVILKPAKHDIREGVITLPLILAIKKSPELRKIATDAMTGHAVDVLVSEVSRVGGIEDAKEMAERYRIKAENVLTRLDNKAKTTYLHNILMEHRMSYGV